MAEIWDFVDETWVVPDGFGRIAREFSPTLHSLRQEYNASRTRLGGEPTHVRAGIRVMEALVAHQVSAGRLGRGESPMHFKAAIVTHDPSLHPLDFEVERRA